MQTPMYRPWLVAAPVKYCPRVNHLTCLSTDKISTARVRRGFHNNRKKRRPSLFRPKAVISHYNLITVCILITILFHTIRKSVYAFEIYRHSASRTSSDRISRHSVAEIIESIKDAIALFIRVMRAREKSSRSRKFIKSRLRLSAS